MSPRSFREPTLGESQHDMARSILQDGHIVSLNQEVDVAGDKLTLRVVKTEGKRTLEAEVEISVGRDRRLELAVPKLTVGP